MEKSGKDWAKELAPDVVILDYEGWMSPQHFNNQRLCREDFVHKLAQSRIIAPKGLYFLWKDKTKNGK